MRKIIESIDPGGELGSKKCAQIALDGFIDQRRHATLPHLVKQGVGAWINEACGACPTFEGRGWRHGSMRLGGLAPLSEARGAH